MTYERMTPKILLEKIDEGGWFGYFIDNQIHEDVSKLVDDKLKDKLYKYSLEAQDAWDSLEWATGNIYDILESEVFRRVGQNSKSSNS